jgi:hypothetical protein
MLDQVPFGRAKLQYLHFSIISYFRNLPFCVTKCLCGLDLRLSLLVASAKPLHPFNGLLFDQR